MLIVTEEYSLQGCDYLKEYFRRVLKICVKRLSVSSCQTICLYAWKNLVRIGRTFI